MTLQYARVATNDGLAFDTGFSMASHGYSVFSNPYSQTREREAWLRWKRGWNHFWVNSRP